MYSKFSKINPELDSTFIKFKTNLTKTATIGLALLKNTQITYITIKTFIKLSIKNKVFILFR